MTEHQQLKEHSLMLLQLQRISQVQILRVQFIFSFQSIVNAAHISSSVACK
jgi:hypothetical protein